MSGRYFAAGSVAALVVATGGAIWSPAPAAAAVTTIEELTGNFAGDERDELFAYAAGPTADFLVSFSNGGSPGGVLTWDEYQHTVNGTFDPIVGNFDADGYDEIIWYAPGTATDYLWNFTGFGAISARPYTANGTYEPVVGDFSGDGRDDVIWYAPGTAQDYIWDFNPDGTRTVLPRTINGAGYRPIAGSFGVDATDDVIWYAPGTATDFFWDYTAGTLSYTSREYPVGGNHRPFVLDIFNEGWQGEDIFFYTAGTVGDSVWDYFLGERVGVYPEVVNGTYRPTSGDYFGDGHDDIVWMGGTGFYLWDHAPNPETGAVERWEYSVFATAAASASTSSAASASEPADDVLSAPVPTGGVPARSGGTIERAGG